MLKHYLKKNTFIKHFHSILAFERKDADYVLRFLNARKFDIPASFQLLINYHLFKERNKELFQKIQNNQDPLCLALQDGFPGVLTQRDRYPSSY